MSQEQKEYMGALEGRLKIGPTNPWTRTPGMTKVRFFRAKAVIFFSLVLELIFFVKCCV